MGTFNDKLLEKMQQSTRTIEELYGLADLAIENKVEIYFAERGKPLALDGNINRAVVQERMTLDEVYKTIEEVLIRKGVIKRDSVTDKLKNYVQNLIIK